MAHELLPRFLSVIADRRAKVVVLGQGYVGLPVAIRASEVGYSVVGFDVSAERIESLRNGVSFVEDISAERLQRALAAKYRPSDRLGDLAGFDVAVISVPTPLRDGLPDVAYIESAGRALARVLRAGALVILESTTYPGTTEEILAPILEESGLRAGADFFLGYSPERIDPGNPNWDLVNTPKVVSGVDASSLQAVEAFFGTIVDKLVPVDSPAEAELVKLIENTFRHVNIALVNELAMFARDMGVDVWRALDAASSKPFGFMRFTPGPGVGGHCLPIDPSYLAWRVRRRLGHTFRFIELANDINEHMPDHVVRRIQDLLNTRQLAVSGSKVLVLGLTYKANTSDGRESPSVRIVNRLCSLGAQVTVCDPHVTEVHGLDIEVPFEAFDADALSTHDLVVILVDHAEFDASLIAQHAKLVFDAKGLLRDQKFDGELL